MRGGLRRAVQNRNSKFLPREGAGSSVGGAPGIRLWRNAEGLLELPAEMGFVGEFQLQRQLFVGVTLPHELPGQLALQLPQPPARRAPELLLKITQQLAPRDIAQRRHLRRLEPGFLRQLLPLLHS